MKRTIIFDWGGVFMKTLDYRPRHRWDERLGLPHGNVERIVHGSESWRAAQLGQISLADYWADVARQLHLDSTRINALAQDFYSGDQLDTELVAYARHLREQGHRIALLSNASPALPDTLRQQGVDDLFQPTVISAFIGVMKPDARAYQYLLEQAGISAQQSVFVDDMPANVEGARALGIHAVHYTTTSKLKTVLDSMLQS